MTKKIKTIKMTSAYANKMLKKLAEDKEYLEEKEAKGRMYIAALDEEPVVPEYDFEEVSAKIAEIDAQVVRIKHAINVTNTTNQLLVKGKKLTIDAVLIRMSQLNRRKQTLDFMRKEEPKTRLETSGFGNKKAVPEYRYINYDMDKVNREYAQIDAEISEMQLELDKFNQTFEFEVEL